MATNTDVYEAITAKIVAILEAGQPTGAITWNSQGEAGGIPYNFKTGQPYSGANVLSLWFSSTEHGFITTAWITMQNTTTLMKAAAFTEQKQVGNQLSD